MSCHKCSTCNELATSMWLVTVPEDLETTKVTSERRDSKGKRVIAHYTCEKHGVPEELEGYSIRVTTDKGGFLIIS